VHQLAYRAQHGVRGIPKVLPRRQVWIVEYLAVIVNRGARNASFFETSDPVLGVPGFRFGLDLWDQRVSIAKASVGIVIGLVLLEVFQLKSATETRPIGICRGSDREPAVCATN